MPILQLPPNPTRPEPDPEQEPSSSGAQPPRTVRTNRYGDLEEHELIHLLDTLDDERARAQFRESVYISTIICLAIAWFLFRFSHWEPTHEVIVDDRGRVVRIDISTRPSEPVPGQEIGIVGSLSSMYSSLYNELTLADDGSVRELRHEPDPGMLADLIPATYWDQKDRALRLWKLTTAPS